MTSYTESATFEYMHYLPQTRLNLLPSFCALDKLHLPDDNIKYNKSDSGAAYCGLKILEKWHKTEDAFHVEPLQNR